MKKWFGSNRKDEDICNMLHKGDYDLKKTNDYIIENTKYLK